MFFFNPFVALHRYGIIRIGVRGHDGEGMDEGEGDQRGREVLVTLG